ncbi:sulfur oxidation c-type cytochrome SoxA [Roseovarius autotrophicus]|uniref:sulfur oxidation c-type cytochrome SoxA n=1 Tax=Roseovarius autotrophicus TaxID=2824121 RepID=UPI0019EFED1C|nr:sulfur oxidation c-type cytochrome SoxA [Roseovarius autotrophicus]MBE0453111.1 sulfur oxidation c-type cytochrome SoxA [Roseovarius sp.]
MTRTKMLAALFGATAMMTGPALAEPAEDTLNLNDEIELVTWTEPSEALDGALTEVISGWHFRGDETRAMQADDFDNPGMMFADQARETWDMVDGAAGKSCASCHGDVDESMKGVRAVYPKWNETAGEVRTLEMQVNACRTEQMQAEPWKYTGEDMINMTALISAVSRGMPMNVAIDGPARETWEKGKDIYYTRFGQLELSCANCHEDNYGRMIRADHLSQGQINGFPTYRLKDAKLVAAQHRFRGCIRDTRAETFAVGSPEFIALELYVASRGNGLSVEGPSVRN